MPGVYEQYEKYRPSMSDTERADLEQARIQEEELRQRKDLQLWERNGKVGFIERDGKKQMLRPFPYMDKEVEIAEARADKQLWPWEKAHMIYPDDPAITDKFPGMDPRGYYTEVDMGFSDRCMKVMAALPSRPPETRAYIDQMLKNALNQGSPMGRVWTQMVGKCWQARDLRRGAKLATSEACCEWMLEDAEQLEKGSADISRVNGFVNVLEYVAGLTDRVPTDQERAFMKNVDGELTPEVEAAREKDIVIPDKIQVKFENLDHQVEQKFFSSPLAWDKTPEDIPHDVASVEAIQDSLSRYAAATGDRFMSPLFERAEKATHGIISRGNLITVDGQTVREVMQEQYNQLKKEGNLPIDEGSQRRMLFEDWFKKNEKQMTGELVSAALMAGKRVEAFIPDKNGNIPKEPKQVTKTGYEPSPLKKVTLNAWERHFSKYGHFKEKVAKAAEYQRVMAARERVQHQNRINQLDADSLVGSRMKDIFFGDYVKENGPIEIDNPMWGLSVSRSGLTTTVICRMIRDGHSMQDILDPDKLKDERKKAAEETVERVKARDDDWLANNLFEGYQKLNKEVEMLASRIDLGDDKQLFAQDSRTLFATAEAIFDLGQEVNRNKEAMNKAAEAHFPDRKGSEVMDELYHESAGLTGYKDMAIKGIQAQSDLLRKDTSQIKSTLASLAAWEYTRNSYNAKRQASPGARFTEDDFAKAMDVQTLLCVGGPTTDFAGQIRSDEVLGDAMRGAILAGDVSRFITVRYDKGGEVVFNADRKGLQERGEKLRRLEGTVKKNEEKEMKKEAEALRKQEKKTEKAAVKRR